MEAAANTTATRIRAEAGESSWTMVDQVSGGKSDGGFGKGNWGGKKLRLELRWGAKEERDARPSFCSDKSQEPIL